MIELLVLDVDGCLTNGSIIYDANGLESKAFNVKDGLGIATWIRMGKKVAIITGRESKVVQKRANELKIDFVFQGVKNKKEKLKELLDELNLESKNVAAIGDDLNDFLMLKNVGLSFAPSDASWYIKKIVDVNLSLKGGEGAIREMIEVIVKKYDLEQRFLKEWIYD